jgi:ribosomal protein S18 acetylase RimI-like enzyme
MSRGLPITLSARYAAPLGNICADRGTYVAWDVPTCRLSWFAHRLELDLPPDDLPSWFARWDDEHAGKGIGRAFLAWETPLDAPPPPLPERYAPQRMLGMVHDGPAPAVASPPLPLRPAAQAELAAVAAAQAAEEPGFGPDHPRYLEWLYRGLAAKGGRTLCAWDGDRPVAAVTVVPGPGEARFQEVWTARAWRRRGLASALVATALARGGRHLLAAVEGSDAHRLYRRLGFEAVSRVYEVSRANE